jgi:ribose 5-phosphate isomerase B
MLKIGCAADHAGFEYKEFIVGYLNAKGYEVQDFGTHSLESMDYPDVIHPLAKLLDKGELDIGFIFCGSGNGVNITANKYNHVRSALCWNREVAVLAKQHNNANCLAIPARFIDKELTREIIDAFLNTDFEGGRHLTRVNKIAC